MEVMAEYHFHHYAWYIDSSLLRKHIFANITFPKLIHVNFLKSQQYYYMENSNEIQPLHTQRSEQMFCHQKRKS